MRAIKGAMDTHMEKQPPISGHAWSPPIPASEDDALQHGIPASSMAAVPVLLSSVAEPIVSQGAPTSDIAAEAAIGIACAAPAKAGIW